MIQVGPHQTPTTRCHIASSLYACKHMSERTHLLIFDLNSFECRVYDILVYIYHSICRVLACLHACVTACPCAARAMRVCIIGTHSSEKQLESLSSIWFTSIASHPSMRRNRCAKNLAHQTHQCHRVQSCALNTAKLVRAHIPQRSVY